MIPAISVPHRGAPDAVHQIEDDANVQEEIIPAKGGAGHGI